MNNTIIDESLYLSNIPQRTTGNSSLGKDEFLKLLIAQLQNQDPLNPMEDREFISQMATFSSLEQLINMTKMFEQFVTSQTNTAIIQSSQVIGKEIKYVEYVDKEDGTKEQIEKTGIVKAISFKGGNITFELDNGDKVKPEYIFEIREKNETSSDE